MRKQSPLKAKCATKPRVAEEFWSRLTPTAVRVIERAKEEAARLGARSVGTEHLLLSMTRVRGQGRAALLWMATDQRALRDEIDKLADTKRSTPRPAEEVTLGRYAHSALGWAMREAEQINPGVGLPEQYVSTGHLLLGLMHERRGASQVLEALAPHITIDAVRRRIVAQLVARQRARDTTVTGAGYLEQVAALIGEISVDRVYRFAELIWKAHGRGRALFAFGNGGSSATAAHFMEDVGKGIEPEARLGRFRALALCESVSLITAWANDSDFADVFAEPLRNFVREGDIVIGISGSGNSENVVRALEVANDRGALTLALTGYDGGRLRNVAREAIVVPSNSMQQIEDVHLVICHQIYIFLKELAETRPASRGRSAASARTRR